MEQGLNLAHSPTAFTAEEEVASKAPKRWIQ